MEMIMLGYDGSTAADAALQWVTERARRAHSWVQVVTITNMFLSERDDAQRMLDAAARELESSAPGISVETHHFDGVMPGTLLDVARGTDLLVIGVDRTHPVREALHGWRSLRMGARSHVPIVIVPSGWAYRPGDVTVGIDDDASSEAAVDFAAAEASRAGEGLRLLHSWSYPSSTSEGASIQRAARAHHDRLDRTSARVHATNRDLKVEVSIAHSNPVSALTSSASVSSLLVIGTHHRGILAGGFVGSTTQDLIGLVDTPICIVPPAAAAARAEQRMSSRDVAPTL